MWMPGSGASTAGGWLPAAGISTAGSTNLPTGLEVALTQQGQEIPMVKSFLLGAL
jgi:general secretion pathway protein J